MPSTTTTLQVDYLLTPAFPDYGLEWEPIGRAEQSFRAVGYRGERAQLQVLTLFGTQQEAEAWLTDLENIREGGSSFYLVTNPALPDPVRLELFLHSARPERILPTTSTRGAVYRLAATLEVTRVSTVRV